MSEPKAELRGRISIPVTGLSLWIRERGIYARVYPGCVQIAYIFSNANKEYAQGERLHFSLKDFQVQRFGEFTKADNRNEVSFWITKEDALKLRNFLDQILGGKMESYL